MSTEYIPVEVTIEVATSKVAFVHEKLAKLNKRLAKLGAPAATLALGEIRQVVETDEATGIERKYNVQDATVTGVEARIAGWTFIASLDHTVAEHENLVLAFPGHEGDEALATLRTAAAHCDHCGLQRTRNVTLVLRNEAGDLRQIGKACAAEYLGIDPSNAINLSYAIRDFDDEEFRRPDYSQPPVLTFVATAFEVVRSFGFVKSRPDDQYATPTVSIVGQILTGGRAARDTIKALNELQGFEIARGEAEAQAAIDWLLSNDDSSDYIYNLRLAVQRPDVHPRTAGLLASLPTAYARALGILAEKAAQREAEEARKVTAEPVPVTDKRIRIEGVVVGTKSKETQWGVSYKLIVLDDRGFKVYGGEPGSTDCSIGDRIAFDAKVERSADDELFGFYTRPTKVVWVKAEAA